MHCRNCGKIIGITDIKTLFCPKCNSSDLEEIDLSDYDYVWKEIDPDPDKYLFEPEKKGVEE